MFLYETLVTLSYWDELANSPLVRLYYDALRRAACSSSLAEPPLFALLSASRAGRLFDCRVTDLVIGIDADQIGSTFSDIFSDRRRNNTMPPQLELKDPLPFMQL